MEAKLIKDHDDYHLVNDTNFIIGTTDEGMLCCTDKMKLSLKNCQAIERGYDLDELANNEFPDETTAGWKDSFTPRERKGFKAGFQKAVELMGDKKFSEDDVVNIAEYTRVASQSTPNVRTKDLFDEYQSLQQTEWDVTFNPDELDVDGCLILKLKLE